MHRLSPGDPYSLFWLLNALETRSLSSYCNQNLLPHSHTVSHICPSPYSNSIHPIRLPTNSRKATLSTSHDCSIIGISCKSNPRSNESSSHQQQQLAHNCRVFTFLWRICTMSSPCDNTELYNTIFIITPRLLYEHLLVVF